MFGSIVNGVVERNDLAENATLLFVSSFLFNFVLSVIVFFLFGGRELLSRRVETGESAGPVRAAQGGGGGCRPARGRWQGGSAATADAGEMPELDRDKILTLIGIVTLIVVALAFDVDVGFVALSIAARAVAVHRRRRPRKPSARWRGRPCC